MIRPIKITEIEDVLAISRLCAKAMQSKGIYQWNEHYPKLVAFENDFKREELYVNIQQDRVIGAVVISNLMDKEYKTVEWLTPNDKNLYIHRLCVHPNFQRKGFAQELMAYAEGYAKKQGYASVRLDTFSQNKRNQVFYEKRGYKKLEDIYYPKQSVHPFPCYELVL